MKSMKMTPTYRLEGRYMVRGELEKGSGRDLTSQFQSKNDSNHFLMTCFFPTEDLDLSQFHGWFSEQIPPQNAFGSPRVF